jgi:hypothetical protein
MNKVDEMILSENVGDIDYRFMREHVFDNIERMKSYEPWKKKLDGYIDRWDKLGFIDGLQGETKEMAALAFEQLAMLIIFSIYKWSNDYFDTVMFPIVRRVIDDIGNKFSIKKFYYLMRENIDFIAKTFDDMQWNMEAYNGRIDIEAEFVLAISGIIAEIMTSEGKWSNEYFRRKINDKITELKLDINERTRNNHTDA